MNGQTQKTTTTRTATRQVDAMYEDTCPVCGHRVPAEIHRHKTLGIYVPAWGPGTCRNPDCGKPDGDTVSRAPGR
ncbi:hypothetical protein [Streptomyces sp. MH60]|uniref:hypothetical protein n=1 Tax=Streptomyces sp. MH60 TaxID=1940758 RepID=UPI001056FD11|nr:hypothetical protein [Streptomyces sp. MH60]